MLMIIMMRCDAEREERDQERIELTKKTIIIIYI